MSETFVASVEKDIGEDGGGKEWRGVPCLAHLAGCAPETKPGHRAAGAPAFSWGASGFPATLRSPEGRDVVQAVSKAKPGDSSSAAPCPDTYTHPTHPSLHHCAAPSP